jgi:hypothetical protein
MESEMTGVRGREGKKKEKGDWEKRKREEGGIEGEGKGREEGGGETPQTKFMEIP